MSEVVGIRFKEVGKIFLNFFLIAVILIGEYK